MTQKPDSMDRDAASGFWALGALAMAFLIGGAVALSQPARSSDCNAIATNVARLACHDQGSQPAKGATIPKL